MLLREIQSVCWTWTVLRVCVYIDQYADIFIEQSIACKQVHSGLTPVCTIQYPVCIYTFVCVYSCVTYTKFDLLFEKKNTHQPQLLYIVLHRICTIDFYRFHLKQKQIESLLTDINAQYIHFIVFLCMVLFLFEYNLLKGQEIMLNIATFKYLSIVNNLLSSPYALSIFHW